MKNLELRAIIETQVNVLDELIASLIEESGPHCTPEEIVGKIDLKQLEDGISNEINKASPGPRHGHIKKNREVWSNISLDYCCNYTNLVEQLNTNTTKVKLKALDELLAIQIINTKQNLWADLAEHLCTCFVSSSVEIFARTLKLHHRIISFPDTSIDGYLNLLKGTACLLTSRYFADLNKTRIWSALQLILGTQKFVIKFLLHTNHKLIDEVITAFINVITFKNVIDYIALLDETAQYFQNFCYGAHIRTSLINTLKTRSISFIKNTIIPTFLTQDNSHSKYFLLHFLSYKQSQTIFPIQLMLNESMQDITINQILEVMIRKHHPEITTILFRNNPDLLNYKLFKLLLEQPFETNLQIINDISLSKTSGILIENKQYKIPQKIMISAALQINDTVLSCVKHLYQSHPTIINHNNPLDFIKTLYYLYKTPNFTSRHAALDLFCYFLTDYPPILKIIDVHEITDDLLCFDPYRAVQLPLNLNSQSCNNLMKTYLENIWYLEEHELELDDKLTELVFFLHVLTFNYRASVAFLVENESTIVESNRSVFLGELIEKTANNYSDSLEEYLGLLAMKVLIKNADLMLYLLANYQIQEKLVDVHQHDIIDRNSCLTNDILDALVFAHTEPLEANENDLSKFLENAECHNDFGWILQARRAFKSSLIKRNSFVLPELLEKIPKSYVYRKKELNWPPPDSVYYQLHPEDFSGISTIIK